MRVTVCPPTHTAVVCPPTHTAVGEMNITLRLFVPLHIGCLSPYFCPPHGHGRHGGNEGHVGHGGHKGHKGHKGHCKFYMNSPKEWS